MRQGLVALLAFAMAGCAAVPAPSCPVGGDAKVRAEIYFGRNIGDTIGVSEAAFRRFIDEEATPRFPDGFTILDGWGQYRDQARNRIAREPSKVLVIVLADEARDAPRLHEIAEAYKKRFRQQSVGIVTQRACAAF
ncbi:MAG: DUF3574 domain-containing protein [Beijerinckiaceae bacterium]